METAEIHQMLVNAKAYLLKYGWIQRHRGYSEEPACIMGSIANSNGLDDIIIHVLPAADVISSFIPDKFASSSLQVSKSISNIYKIIRWNDSGGRTIEEVIAVLDKAILATAPEQEIQEQAESVLV